METPFTDAELAAECRRELGLRIGFYPKLVKSNKLSQEQADKQTALMRQAAGRLDALSKAAPASASALALRQALADSRAKVSDAEVPLALADAQSRLTILLLKGKRNVADVALEVAALAVRLSEPVPSLPEVTPPSTPLMIDMALASTDAPVMHVESDGKALKEELIRLLNHPVITRQEKTKTLLNIHRLSDEGLRQKIGEFTNHINLREGNDVQVVARKTA